MLSTDALVAFGLYKSVGLVTDARFSGFNYGPIVGHVCPEPKVTKGMLAIYAKTCRTADESGAMETW